MKKAVFVLPFIFGLAVTLGILAPRYIPSLQRNKPLTALLYNHIVYSHAAHDSFENQYSQVTQTAFDQQLAILQKRNVQFLNRDEFNAGLKNEPGAWKDREQVVILFREGFGDIAVYGLPVLAKHQVPAIVFFAPQNVNKPGFLTADQATQLLKTNIAVTQPNYAILFNNSVRKEVSGLIQKPQFEDLLPTQYITSLSGALALGFLIFCASLLTLVRPRWAICLPIIALPLYLVRMQLFGIPFTFLELSIFSVAGTIIIARPRAAFKSIKSFPYLAPTILFLAASFLATWFAQDKTTALGGLKALVLEPIAYAIAVIALSEHRNVIKQLLGSLIITTTLIACYALVQFWLGNYYVTSSLDHLTTYFGNPNYLASFLSFGILPAVATFFIVRGKAKLGMAGVIAVLGICLYLTRSDTGIMGILAGMSSIAVYFVVKNTILKQRITAALVALVIAGSFALFLAIANTGTRGLLEHFNAATLVSRSYIYQVSADLIRTVPLTGVGLLNYNHAFIEAVPPESPEQDVALSHNTFLDLWTQSGIFALIAYLWLTIRFLIRGIKQYTLASIMLVAIMVSMLVHGMLDSQYHKNDYALVYWTLLGLASFLGKDR